MIKKFNEYSKFNEGFDFLKDIQGEYARKNTYENRVPNTSTNIYYYFIYLYQIYPFLIFFI